MVENDICGDVEPLVCISFLDLLDKSVNEAAPMNHLLRFRHDSPGLMATMTIVCIPTDSMGQCRATAAFEPFNGSNQLLLKRHFRRYTYVGRFYSSHWQVAGFDQLINLIDSMGNVS